MYGYHYKVLVVNLTDRSHRWDPVDEETRYGRL